MVVVYGLMCCAWRVFFMRLLLLGVRAAVLAGVVEARVWTPVDASGGTGLQHWSHARQGFRPYSQYKKRLCARI